MERYAVIHDKFPREFILLQGRGCRWGQCTFCDYHHDTSDAPFSVNKEVLKRVTGEYGVLDIINSGSGIELDEQTIELIKEVVREKRIHTLWFEMHYMYRHRLAKFAAQFAPAKVKFRCGIESFDGAQRKRWNKGVPADVTVDDVARYFQGVCLLCCTRGESRERISNDIHLAEKYFEYFSVNLFCNNGTSHERDEELVTWFIDELYPSLKDSPKAEVLLNNTDLTVGG
jgi:hypothetical protein